MLGKQAWRGKEPGATLDSGQSLTLAAEPSRRPVNNHRTLSRTECPLCGEQTLADRKAQAKGEPRRSCWSGPMAAVTKLQQRKARLASQEALEEAEGGQEESEASS